MDILNEVLELTQKINLVIKEIDLLQEDDYLTKKSQKLIYLFDNLLDQRDKLMTSNPSLNLSPEEKLIFLQIKDLDKENLFLIQTQKEKSKLELNNIQSKLKNINQSQKLDNAYLKQLSYSKHPYSYEEEGAFYDTK